MSAQFEPIVGRYMHLDLFGRPHRLYVEEAGKGTPLLCLHTAGSDGRQYRALMNDARITAMLVRGEDTYGHFDLEPRPAGDFDAAARAAHADAVNRFFESNKLLTARRRSGNVGI